jgi:heme-degrading monooxygenase HmoA
VDDQPGFEGFQLLRPVAGESRYFVVTTWATQADFEAWRDGRASATAHQDPSRKPVATGATLLEFEVVDLDASAARG